MVEKDLEAIWVIEPCSLSGYQDEGTMNFSFIDTSHVSEKQLQEVTKHSPKVTAEDKYGEESVVKEESMWQCWLCDQCFPKEHLFKKHMEQLHQKRVNSIVRPCSYCGKTFTTMNRLKEHEDQHQGQYKKHCPQCSKGFNNVYSLKAHQILQHNAAAQLQCTKCTRVFMHHSSLKRHEKCCGDQKFQAKPHPYSCQECNKSYTSKAGLYAHKRMHSVQKDIVCLDCGECFNYLTQLYRHRQKCPATTGQN